MGDTNTTLVFAMGWRNLDGRDRTSQHFHARHFAICRGVITARIRSHHRGANHARMISSTRRRGRQDPS
jgi:hypothetical protein